MESPLPPIKPPNPAPNQVATPHADPCNRASFLARVETYKPSTWFAKPCELSPLVCAGKGWVNCGRNLLKCWSCGSFASFEFPTQLAHDLKHLLEDLVKSLTDAHSPGCPWATARCPVEFEKVQTVPRTLVLNEMVARLLELDQIWDLPRLEPSLMSQIEEGSLLKVKLGKVLEWNLVRMKEAFAQGGMGKGDVKEEGDKIDTRFVSDEAWDKRNVKLVSLALLGWKVHVLPGKVYVKSEEEAAKGRKRKRPWCQVDLKPGKPNKGYTLGRETVLRCEHCATQAGMWGFGSEPGIELLKFQKVASRNAVHAQELTQDAPKSEVGTARSSMQSILTTKKVEKSLVGTIAGGVVSKLDLDGAEFGMLEAKTLFQLGSATPSPAPKPSLESLLSSAIKTPENHPGVSAGALGNSGNGEETESDVPIFGLGSYKKRKSSGVKPVEIQLAEKGALKLQKDDGMLEISPEDYVETVDGVPFDPVGWHRYFCPWRTGWKNVLNSLVE